MNKQEVRQQIIDVGVVPVLRVSSDSLALAAADAVCRGGINILEVTMTVPKAVDVIRKLVASMGRAAVVGAGTVLDARTAQECIDAGAQFLVSPIFDIATIHFANDKGILVMAGALTPSEVVGAWNNGSDFVKVFPCGNAGGPSYIKALKGPLPNISMIPTGGVSIDNAQAYIKAGAAAIGVGSDLISEKELKAGNHQQITILAGRFVAAVREARAATQA